MIGVASSEKESSAEDSDYIKELCSLYEFLPQEKIIMSTIDSSILSKLISNAMLAQRISSINSVSAICEQCDAKVLEVKKCVGADKRIGSPFLSPSIAFGGSCFRKVFAIQKI